MARLWPRLSTLKFAVAIATTSFVAFLLLGMVSWTQLTQYSWKAQEKLARNPFDKSLQHDTGDVQKEIVRIQKQQHTGNQTASDSQNRQEERKGAKCSKTVASLTKYSKWFRERYRPGIKLFLDKDDTHPYDNLSSHGLPFGFKGQNQTVISQILLHENFTNPSVNGKGSRKQGCIRCAVVGCGGILNGSGAGEEIDSHDYVFRLNRAISAGKFAEDVGNRTSFYTFFPESQHIYDVEDKNVLLFFTMFKKYDVDYALNMVKDVNPPRYVSRGREVSIKKPAADPRKIKIVHPAFFKYVFHTFLEDKSHRPTTGALVVFLALHICDEVTIYGFGYDSRFTMHYYDKRFVVHTNKSTGSHDVDNERKLWMKLHEEGAIRLFKRDV